MIFKGKQNHQFQIADLKLDPQTGEIWQVDHAISLPKLSFKLLQVLAEHSPATVSQDKLIELIWKDSVVGDEALKQRVKLLRKSLGDNAQSPQYIGVVRGRGYYLIPKVKVLIIQPKLKSEYEFIFNERIPDLSSVEGMKIWRKMSFILMFSILALVLVLYTLNSQLNKSTHRFDRHRLAILPFVNITENIEDNYLAKGITRELIESMSHREGISVAPLKMVQQYNHIERKVSEIAQRLDVGNILESTLRRNNNLLYFNFKLINSNSSNILWETQFSVGTNDLLEIQRQVITQVTAHLKANLIETTPVLNTTALSQPTNRKQAESIYKSARDYYYRYRSEDNKIAIKLFKQALDIDASFGAAHAGLADAYSQGVFQFGGNDEWRELAFQSALKAVEINPQNEVAHKAKALAQYLKGHIQAAIASNLTAVKLKPRYIQATTNLGFFYRESGQLTEALKWNLRTLEINQNYAPGYLHLAQTYSAKGQFNKAENNFKRALELKPDYVLAKQYYALFLATHHKLQLGLNLLELDGLRASENYSLFVTAGDIALLSSRYELAKQHYQKSAQSIELKKNIRLRIKISICEHLLNKINYLKNELVLLKQTLKEEQNNNSQDFVLLSIAYSALDNYAEASFFLEQAKNYGLIDKYFIEAHGLLSPL